ncbi:restriction endonuclease subunit S [Massilia antarctica]|uniref:Restriction endonuclease subunit S n=1 Tax=Massilia antarctica TaxID=2765360 RepID=A0AA48WHL8_9BURK|nr:restriction endonuclease subunit S [Massilia antarctica]QPI51883.1 restriction endonuclease subunit S [Massilia antarctica]
MSATPVGYKQTEVGVIPDDWETGTMLGISRQIMDFRGRTPKKLGMNWGGDIPALSAGNVRMGFIDFDQECYFGSDVLYSLWMTRGDLAKGDVLFTTEAPLGNVALVPDDRKYILSQRTVLIQVVKQRTSSEFLFQMMRSDAFQRMLTDYSSGSTAKGIQRKKFEQLCVALPPLDEQEAIAEALSDADALIESLEQLVTKKRYLKQGVMQDLLTGKKRLPGFSGKWEVMGLDTVAEIRSGGTPSTNQPEYWDGDILWCTPTDITGLKGGKYLAQTSRTISGQGLRCSSAEIIPPNSVVMTSRATIGECAINVVPVATNQGFKNFVPFETTDGEFLYYFLQTRKQEFISLCGGSTFLEIGKTQLAAFEITVPKDKLEQTAIAAILSDMDAEIADLEAHLTKARAIKQGMMNQLLTGKIRLI